MSEDPLDDIFVDKNEPADKKIIAEILSGLVTIDSDGLIQLSDEGHKLNEGKKVLLCLVCRKAMFLKGIILGDKEFIGPKEISEQIGVSEASSKKATSNTYNKFLKNLKGKNIMCHCTPKKCHGDYIISLLSQDVIDGVQLE